VGSIDRNIGGNRITDADLLDVTKLSRLCVDGLLYKLTLIILPSYIV